nr:hypothetical protein [Mycobacterium tuberculosis]
MFGGNEDAWSAFDPTTVITRHGSYTGLSGWFAISSPGPPSPDNAVADTTTMRLAGQLATPGVPKIPLPGTTQQIAGTGR